MGKNDGGANVESTLFANEVGSGQKSEFFLKLHCSTLCRTITDGQIFYSSYSSWRDRSFKYTGFYIKKILVIFFRRFILDNLKNSLPGNFILYFLQGYDK